MDVLGEEKRNGGGRSRGSPWKTPGPCTSVRPLGTIDDDGSRVT